MNNQNLTISRDNALKAYKSADKSQKQLLKLLFGADTFKQPQDVKARVKTFEDACRELGATHPYVQQYHIIIGIDDDKAIDILAYLKLCIITAALNEGWEPQFTEDECRCYPWFELITQSELNKMSDDEKGRVVGRAYNYSGGYVGLAYAGASIASSYSNGNFGSRLAFKTRKLAEYAGRQFVELYADFVFPEL